MITEAEIQIAQGKWGAGIVFIGEGTSWEASKDRAETFIKKMYVMDGSLLFFPTKTCQIQSRPNLEGALSYFVGRNEKYPEDGGFALQPWTAVRFENAGFVLRDNMALAMGNYFFTDTDGGETKVVFTFAYVRGGDGELCIQAHHSALPYNPAA
jgi:hypothetical protein